MIHSYPSIYNLGHAAIATLLHGDVVVEEKIDGSQISFGCYEIPHNTEGDTFPELVVRSKGAVVNTIAPEGLFSKAVTLLKEIQDKLPVNVTFRGEYLAKPKHNVLAYDRAPTNNIIIFDIDTGEQAYMSPAEKKALAESLGFETVPVLFEGKVEDPTTLRAFLERDSILGGQKIEGMVIKPAKYDLFGRDKKVLMGKFVSEKFKEIHANDWKKEHGPESGKDVVGRMALQYATPARWQKALIHLREQGKIEDSPKDIGQLIAEVAPDVLKECEAEIREQLFKWAWPMIKRSLTRGLPQWYKEELLKKQFE